MVVAMMVTVVAIATMIASDDAAMATLVTIMTMVVDV
jgi:hypothetical protein